MSYDPTAQRYEHLDMAVEELRQMPTPETPANELLLLKVRKQPVAQHQGASSSDQPIMFLVRSRMSQSLAAASFLALIAIGWLFANVSAATTIAQVIGAVSKHELVKYRIQKTGEFKDELKDFYRGNASDRYIMYSDLRKPRMRLKRPSGKTLNDIAEQSWEEILDYEADRYLQIYRFDLLIEERDATEEIQKQLIRDIFDQEKSKQGSGPLQRTAKLFRIPRPDKDKKTRVLRPYSDMGKDHTFLETLQTLQSRKETVSTQEKRDGRNTTKYHLAEDVWTSVVWADAESKLPIRAEFELVGEATGKTLASMKWIYTDFEWDPKVNNIEGLFSTTPPEGYEFEDHTSDQ